MEVLIVKNEENTAESLVTTGSKHVTTPIINVEDLNRNQEQGGDPVRTDDKPDENTRAPETQPSSCLAIAPEDVLCDSCIERPSRAQRSCLTCLVSYCEAHLRPHLENQKFQNHRLVEPLQDIESRSCLEHRLPLELYCLTDGCSVCVCCECVGLEHPGHRTVPVGEARRQVETELQKKQGEILKTVSSVENAIGKLQNNTASIESSVAGARAVMEQQFYLLQGAMDEARRGTTEVLEDEQRQAISQAEGIQAHLEQKSQELKKTLASAERLSRNKTDVDFLQEYTEWKRGVVDVCLPGVYIGLTERMASFSRLITESTQGLCDQLKATYTDKLKDFCKTDKPGNKTTVHAKMSRSSPLPDPVTRDDFLKYARSSLTFDPNTVHKFLRLTEDNRKVTNTAPWQHNYPDAPERFENWRQVMTSESLYLGRHYFEVELSGEGAYVGLTYKSIDRKGAESGSCITGNDFSWSLGRDGRSFFARHADVEADLEAAGGFTRHGVYIDFDSGSLAFYGVDDSAVTLLYRYDAQFTEPLYPTVWLPKKDSVVLLVSPKDQFPNVTTTPTTPVRAIAPDHPEP
ncbi:tripartite motif-containing protein 16-like protein [Esox lucius]|uniref:B30.2/SPRY domain-containing protein n=1 Tax=Esox lucius TaxID=8010 RepID=A0A3P8YAH5_ESOLU|nr:tripartite motif-containing protein 16-like protein [Esox lucius]